MKFVVVGAGGIGCYYAARLIAAGHQVVLVARGEHLTALTQHGLRVTHPEFHFHQLVMATDVDGLLQHHRAADVDWLLLASKSAATAPLMQQLAPWLASHLPLAVLSLQNGVDNEAHIAEVIGKSRTVGGLAVKIGAHIVSPGCVEATGMAQVDFGAWPNAAQNAALQTRLASLAQVFSAANIPNKLYDDESYALWRKLVINNGVNPLAALTKLDTRALTSHPVFSQTVKAMMQETGRAATAEGVPLTDAEIDDICGPVIRGCNQAGIPATTTALIQSLLLNAVEQAT